MTLVYAESSAVLGWLLGEPSQDDILRELARATRVLSSTLTLVECTRGLARARRDGRITDADELAALRLLDEATASWDLLAISDRVVARARARFPAEPVRTLDALHLSSALVLHEALGGMGVVSLDDRIRTNAIAMGLIVYPA